MKKAFLNFRLEISVSFPNDASISCSTDLTTNKLQWEFWQKYCPGSTVLLNEDIEKADRILEVEGERAWKKAKTLKLGEVLNEAEIAQGEFGYLHLVYKKIRWKGCDLYFSADISIQTHLG